MKAIFKSWKHIITFGVIIICFIILSMRLYAEETVDATYAYQLNTLSVDGLYIDSVYNDDRIEGVKSVTIQNYDDVKVENMRAGKYYIYAGKISVIVDTSVGRKNTYAKYSVKGITGSNATYSEPKVKEYASKVKETLSFKSSGLNLYDTTGNVATSALFGWWRTSDGTTTYYTYYDIEFKNISDNDFVMNTSGAYFTVHDSNFKVIYDADERKITLTGAVYLESIKKMYLVGTTVFGKTLVWDDLKTGESATSIDLTEDRTFKVYNADNSVSNEYTVHADMPWKLDFGGLSVRNYYVDQISYGTVSNIYDSMTNYSIALNNVPSGSKVTVIVSPKSADDQGKVIESVTLTDESGGALTAEVVPNSNTFSFTMPASVVTAGATITFKEADATMYSLSGDVAKTSSNIAMGSISFQNENGNVISTARAGQKIKASTAPRESSYYDFGFTGWSSENISLTDEQKTSSEIEFYMPASNVVLTAGYEKRGTNVTLSSGDYSMGQAQMMYPDETIYQILPDGRTNGKPVIDTIKKGATLSFEVYNVDSAYQCSGWEITKDGNKVEDKDITWRDASYTSNNQMVVYQAPVITVDGDNIQVKVLFEARKYATVSVSSAYSAMGSAGIGDTQVSSQSVFSGDTVTISAAPSSDMYEFDDWKILSPDQTNADEADMITLTDISASGSTTAKATFTMIDKPVEIQAVFKKVKFSSEKLLLSAVILDKNDPAKTIGRVSSQGTNYTITLPDTLTPEEAATLVSGGSYLKLTASNLATIAQSGGYDEATGEKRWANGEVETKLSLNTPCTFTVTAEDGTTQDYTITIVYEERKSSEKEITEVVLLDKVTKDVIVSGTLEGTAWTVQLPQTLTAQEAGQLASGGAYLKVTASDKASVAQEGSYDDKGQVDSWGSGNVLCYMDLNKAVTFTVTAEDGSTQAYTITIAYTEPAPDQPVLTAGTVDRTSDSEAKITFTSDMAGKYYYRLAESGAVPPDMDLSGDGLTAKKGTNTISLTTLSAGAKDLYIVVVSSNGNASDVLKIAIPAYDEAEIMYKISLSYPTAGGTITVSSTSAKTGETITVAVTPKTGKRLVPGSLKYSESTAGGAVVNIDEKTLKFTMPASEISISCTWEDDTSDTPSASEKAITTFMINGVTGTINDTASTISITLPNGTDLTSLSPVIGLGDDVKSISPASGKTVDLSKPVIYTVTMKDGTTKQYTVTAYTEAPTKSEQLWEQMLENIGGNTSSSGSGTWWEKAKKEKKKNDFPSYW